MDLRVELPVSPAGQPCRRTLPAGALAIAGGDFAAFARALDLPVFGKTGQVK